MHRVGCIQFWSNFGFESIVNFWMAAKNNEKITPVVLPGLKGPSDIVLFLGHIEKKTNL